MKLWEKNVGAADRLARGAAGAVLLLAVTIRAVQPPLMYAAFLAGLVLIATAYFGTCVLYSALGMSTAGKARPAGRRKR